MASFGATGVLSPIRNRIHLMSEISDRILSVDPAKPRKSKATGQPPGKRGLAPKIRQIHVKYPELSHAQIAKRVGCRPSNVTGVLRTFLGKHSETTLRNYQENQADVFDSVAMRLIMSVSQKKIDKTPAVQAITGAAILIDKARLVRGQATGINAVVLMDVVDALRAKHNRVNTIDAKPVDHEPSKP